jgi:hypothetical protein
MTTVEQKAALMEKGEVIYIEGDVYDLRERLASIGEFFVCNIGGNNCKVTKAGRKSTSELSWLETSLKTFQGMPIKYNGNVPNLRNYISKHNAAHGTAFKVRSTGGDGAEVYSESLDDYASITQEQLDIEAARMAERLEKLRSKLISSGTQEYEIVDQDEDDDEEEEDLTPDPSIFVTRAKYADIVDEDEEDIV